MTGLLNRVSAIPGCAWLIVLGVFLTVAGELATSAPSRGPTSRPLRSFG